MEIKIVSTKRNELLKRNEVYFMVRHEKDATPPRIKVREKIAGVLGVEVDRVFIRRMESVTGAMMSIGEAHVYDSPDYARLIEPEHIIARNTLQEKEK
ncbi:MAG: 30S ribosomal protein S24e [Candidatus Bathyarchaeia archaeon]